MPASANGLQPVLQANDVAPGKPPLRIWRAEPARLVVVIPALNEEPTIRDVIRRVPGCFEGVESVEVVVVDDGSSDRTAEIARSEGAIVVSHPRASGVGAAFQSGLRKALERGADVVINIDGDGQFSPEDIPKLVGPILADAADFVTASRFIDPDREPRMPRLKRWGNRQLSRLVSWLLKSEYHDVSCGMRAYSRKAALSLNLVEAFTYTHEVFLHLACKRMRVVEVPIDVRGEREHGNSRVAKNLFRYAMNVLGIIFRFYRDYYPMRFFGTIALFFLGIGVPLGAFSVHHYITAGAVAPHKWAAITSGSACCCSLIAFLMGLLGDMLRRQQSCMEEILYYTRSLVAAKSSTLENEEGKSY